MRAQEQNKYPTILKESDTLGAQKEVMIVNKIGITIRFIIRVARAWEWAFGTVLMGTITVVLLLQNLDKLQRCFLLGCLFVFLFATLVRVFDDTGWFNRWKQEFFFEHTGMSLETSTGAVLLNVTFRAKPKVIVQKLHLEINGIRFEPSNWAPFEVSPQYTNMWEFELAGKVDKVNRGKLIATVNKKEYESRQVDF